MTETSFDGPWALIPEGDESGVTAGIAFINAAAGAARPDIAPRSDGMIDLSIYSGIVIDGGVAWWDDRPEARGTCSVDGDTAVIEIADPSPDARGAVERLTLRRSGRAHDILSGTLHSVLPGDRHLAVANDDESRSVLDFGFSDPCTLIRRTAAGEKTHVV